MKTLLFGEGLLAPTLEGRKRITIRKFRAEAHSFIEGEIILGKFAEGPELALRILADTKVLQAGALSDAIAREDGFADAADMMVQMRRYYPDFGPETQVGVIRYETFEAAAAA